MSERCTGIVLSADIDGRGFGFLRSPGFEKDVFYHVHNVVDRGIAEGQTVSFVAVANGTKGWKATDIRACEVQEAEGPVDRSEKNGRSH